MKEDILCCSKCGREPEVVNIAGLWYVQCQRCGRICVSLRENSAKSEWNTSWGRAKGDIDYENIENKRRVGNAIRRARKKRKFVFIKMNLNKQRVDVIETYEDLKRLTGIEEDGPNDNFDFCQNMSMRVGDFIYQKLYFSKRVKND